MQIFFSVLHSSLSHLKLINIPSLGERHSGFLQGVAARTLLILGNGHSQAGVGYFGLTLLQ